MNNTAIEFLGIGFEGKAVRRRIALDLIVRP